jgi:endothelin-converting enzyme
VNGRLTLGENIADAGGLSAAFHAWKKRDEASSDKLLPGLDHFTKEQLFFVGYSSWWCSKTTKEAAVRAIYQDPHAPKPARILVGEYPSLFIFVIFCSKRFWPTESILGSPYSD